MKTLVLHSLETSAAKKLALELGGEIEVRKSHFRIHTKKDFDIENFRLSNNFDLNIFDNNFDVICICKIKFMENKLGNR